MVVVGRTPAKVDKIADELGADRFVADFARLDDVVNLAAQLRERYERIDVLANNAGGLFAEREVTADGFEMTFQVNHLAPFLLTNLLLDRPVASRALVINTSSEAHRRGRLDLTDLQLEHHWTKWRSYCTSKLANLVFTRALHRRYVLDGLSTAAFHPGVVASSFCASRGATQWFYRSSLGKRLMVSPEQGADTLVWLANSTLPRDWASGLYYIKRTPSVPIKAARDDGPGRCPVVRQRGSRRP